MSARRVWKPYGPRRCGVEEPARPAIANGVHRRPRTGSVYTRLAILLRWLESCGHDCAAAAGTSLVAFDVASGAKASEVALPKEQGYEAASAGPGKVYVLSSSSLTLVSD